MKPVGEGKEGRQGGGRQLSTLLQAHREFIKPCRDNYHGHAGWL